MSTAADLRLTNADIELMPEDGNRYELIDGELYVSSAPSFFHQTILMNIAIALSEYLRRNPIGRVAPGVGVIFDDYNGVIPDLVIATHGRMSKTLIGGRFHAAPEIVIEILSPGASNQRRDRQIKRNLYAARGVGEYWVVDPENRSVEVYRRDAAGELVFDRNIPQDDNLTTEILPEFAVRVDSLFV
jgi:Uma2 family endonuclease